jgi:hypothetical protein
MRVDGGERKKMLESKKVSTKIFKFGESEYKASSVMNIPCWVGGEKIYIRTVILKGDIPWLIGRETMAKLKMEINVGERKVTMGALGYRIIQVREDEKGHLKMKMMRKVEKEEVWMNQELGGDKEERKKKLRKLHLQFGHPGWERLAKLIEEANREYGKNNRMERGNLKDEIKGMTEECDLCIRYKRNPSRPVVGMPWAKFFNEVVSLDLGEIEGKRFMMMVDLATKYCQACWVRSKKPEDIMEGLMEKWIGIFGAPQYILSDNGGEFQNEKMRIMLEKFNIKMKSTPAESPWSNGICEKWVGLIKDSLRKLKGEENVELKIGLGWSVAAKNALYNNKGFSPNQLVFGRNPALPNVIGEINPAMIEEGNETQLVRENLNAMHKGRVIHVQQEAEEKIKRAFKHQIREHKLEDVEMNEEVYYKREDEKEWRGPAKVIGIDGKTVIVKHGGSMREIARVHITRIKVAEKMEEGEKEGKRRTEEVERDKEDEIIKENLEYRQGIRTDTEESEEESEEEEVESEEDEVIEIPKIKRGERIRALSKITREREEWRILGRAGKSKSKKWSDSYNVQNMDDGSKKWVDLREYDEIQIIPAEEEILLGFEDKEVLEAKLKELRSWEENKVYEEEKDRGQKTISIRWIITEKIKEGKRCCKARLVARGFEEKMGDLSTDAPTCAPEILKLCLSIMIMRGWQCQSIDIKTAYLQGDHINRMLYIKPPMESGSDGIWRLKKTIYGLKDAAKAWYNKVKKVVEELGGIKNSLEPVLFYWKDGDGKLMGIMCSHVDDFCYGGNEEFQERIIEELESKLKVGEKQKGVFKYIGVNIKQGNENIELKQDDYVRKIKIPEKEQFGEEREMNGYELTEYRSLIGKLNWVAQHTRPELSFAVSDLSKAFQGGSTEDMRKLLRVVKKMKGVEGGIKLDKLKLGEERWEVYADASFGNGEDGQSQIGYIVSLVDGEGRRCPIQWKSNKAKRIAKSTIEAETLSLGEAAETGIYLNRIYQEVTGKKNIPIIMKTDSKTLEKAVKSTSGVKSRILRIDMAALKEMLEKGEIKVIDWVNTKDQVADILTKNGVNEKNMKEYVWSKNKQEKSQGEGREEDKLDKNPLCFRKME